MYIYHFFYIFFYFLFILLFFYFTPEPKKFITSEILCLLPNIPPINFGPSYNVLFIKFTGVSVIVLTYLFSFTYGIFYKNFNLFKFGKAK